MVSMTNRDQINSYLDNILNWIKRYKTNQDISYRRHIVGNINNTFKKVNVLISKELVED